MLSPHQATSRIPVVEVVIRQELDLSGLSRLNGLLNDALALQPVVLVVDVAQCPFMDAAAIDVLLEAHRRARRDGGLLTLRSPSPRLRRNLRLARADRVLHVTPAEPDDPNGHEDASHSRSWRHRDDRGGADDTA